jgi:hypothetical protein
MFSRSLNELTHVNLRVPFNADTYLAKLVRCAMIDQVCVPRNLLHYSSVVRPTSAPYACKATFYERIEIMDASTLYSTITHKNPLLDLSTLEGKLNDV